jgi:hypothetical protein
MKREPKDSRDRAAERGTTLVFTLLILLALLTLTVAGLLASGSDLKISSNYQTGLQALLNAETGILHAKQTLDQLGVARFNTDVVAKWGSLFGTSSLAVSGYPLLRYSVSATTDATDPTGHMLLTSSGQAPNEAQRFVGAVLALDGAFSPGAIYLPGDSVTPNFNGNKFLVDGNDTNLDGSANPSGTVPGISARDADVAATVLEALSTGQDDNVIGAGGQPSVHQSTGFTSDELLNGIIPGILSAPTVITNPVLHGSDIFGTRQNPQITHFTGNVNVTGNLSGVGILIVDQGLTISGSTTFTGLIIVKGTTQITTVQGNTTILGALWTTDLKLTVGGSASLTYSTEALRLVNAMFTSPPLPQHVKVVSWKEY